MNTLKYKSKKSKTLKLKGGKCGCGFNFGGGINQKGCGHKNNGKCKKCLQKGKVKKSFFSKKNQKGGHCGTCSMQRGGNSNFTTAFVGQPWTSSIKDWPGVSGVQGVTNYFPLNQYKVDPQTQVMQERAGSLFTGVYKGGKKQKKRGGGLLPQDLVNFGRTFEYGLGSAYNAANGYSLPVSPLPYQDQFYSK
jgi:hypothetical protein